MRCTVLYRTLARIGKLYNKETLTISVHEFRSADDGFDELPQAKFEHELPWCMVPPRARSDCVHAHASSISSSWDLRRVESNAKSSVGKVVTRSASSFAAFTGPDGAGSHRMPPSRHSCSGSPGAAPSDSSPSPRAYVCQMPKTDTAQSLVKEGEAGQHSLMSSGRALQKEQLQRAETGLAPHRAASTHSLQRQSLPLSRLHLCNGQTYATRWRTARAATPKRARSATALTGSALDIQRFVHAELGLPPNALATEYEDVGCCVHALHPVLPRHFGGAAVALQPTHRSGLTAHDARSVSDIRPASAAVGQVLQAGERAASLQGCAHAHPHITRELNDRWRTARTTTPRPVARRFWEQSTARRNNGSRPHAQGREPTAARSTPNRLSSAAQPPQTIRAAGPAGGPLVCNQSGSDRLRDPTGRPGTTPAALQRSYSAILAPIAQRASETVPISIRRIYSAMATHKPQPDLCERHRPADADMMLVLGSGDSVIGWR